jgi:hypothetical protein
MPRKNPKSEQAKQKIEANAAAALERLRKMNDQARARELARKIAETKSA